MDLQPYDTVTVNITQNGKERRFEALVLEIKPNYYKVYDAYRERLHMLRRNDPNIIVTRNAYGDVNREYLMPTYRDFMIDLIANEKPSTSERIPDWLHFAKLNAEIQKQSNRIQHYDTSYDEELRATMNGMKCRVCGKEFEDYDELMDHEILLHGVNEPYRRGYSFHTFEGFRR